MGLLSHLKRQSAAPSDVRGTSSAEPDAVVAARSRARRRLIGATVLLGIGVIGFPLLFETQPRPVSVNIPIEIPRKDGAPPLVLPPAAPLTAASAAVLDQAPAPVFARPDDRAAAAGPVGPATAAVEIVERATDPGREAPAVAALPVPRAEAVKPALAASKPPAAARPADDGARARALLDGNTTATAPASAPAARMVVQVGAYADATKLADARQKLEALGLKTYTQVVEVDGAKRTRVRVGPFASRADADKAAARIKSAGLPVAILTL
jgi:DedD protein